MDLRKTLRFVHDLLVDAKIEHSLIGGLGLACYRSTRATVDLDLLIARRPISQDILKLSNTDGPEGIKFVRPEDLIGLKIQAYQNDMSREFQDKADIQYLIETQDNLNWDLIKRYADLFSEWESINAIKKKIKS